MSAPSSKKEIISSLQVGFEEVSAAFKELSPEQCLLKVEGRWSAAENLDHLIRSVVPLAKGLEMPTMTLRMMFGRSSKSSRSFDEVVQAYKELLANGGAAMGRYLPTVLTDVSDSQQTLLSGWERAGKRLVVAVEKWKEADFDVYRIPHPLLGKMTVREMLFFTVYHNSHHGRRIEEASSK
ncbi:MAG: DinB family protein [Calditrichia bacterium]